MIDFMYNNSTSIQLNIQDRLERMVRKMNITDVRVRKVNDEGKMKAVVSITFDDEFVVHDIKIIEGQNGLFIAMPSRKMGEGDFRDIAHPLVSETRNKIKEAIFVEYEKVLAEKNTMGTINEK